MQAAEDIQSEPKQHRAPWRWDGLTPSRCRWIFAGLVLFGFVGHVVYLQRAVIDLSGDEAHYWDWSRRLDWSYYSKGPLVAYIIRASCAVFGDTMLAVRLPALVLAAMTSVVTYLLTLRLFKSDRLALGVAVLQALVPIFIAGSMLMTIDPPFFFCWAAATYCLTFALDSGVDEKDEVGRMKDEKGRANPLLFRPSSFIPHSSPWAWPAAGLFVGVGFLAKYASLLWLPAMLLFLAIDRASRPRLKTAGPWVAVVLALLCTTPVMVWNAQHQWVTFRHVAHQTGMEDDNDDDAAELRSPAKPAVHLLERMGEFVGGQVGVVGPLIVFMAGGALYAFGGGGRGDPHRRALQLLATVGGFFFLLNFLETVRGKVQINWPAPAYFTLIILAGYFMAVCMKDPDRWRHWRNWAYATVVYGLIVLPIAHDFSLAHPILRGLTFFMKKPPNVARLDPTTKLTGWKTLGQSLSQQLATMPEGTFILCDDYQQTAETAFYTAGQPITYCAGSYYDEPKRHTQYDLWPDRDLVAPNPLVGRDAIYVGKGNSIPREVTRAFEHVTPLGDIDIITSGVKIRSFRPFRCEGFKGMPRPAANSAY